MGCLPFAPKDSRVCQNCQWYKKSFYCISHTYALYRFNHLTEDEFQHLPTKGTHYPAAKDRHRNQYLLSSIEDIVEAKKTADQVPTVLSSEIWEFEAATCEDVMLELYTGNPAILQSAFARITEDIEASLITPLVKLFVNLVARASTIILSHVKQQDSITSNDIEHLIQFHSALLTVEDELPNVLDANSRSDQLQLAIDLLEQKPGYIYAGVKVTWRELLARGFKKDLLCFISALDKAVVVQKKKAAAHARKEEKKDAARHRQAEARSAGLACSKSGCVKEKALRCDTKSCSQHCRGPCARHHK